MTTKTRTSGIIRTLGVTLALSMSPLLLASCTEAEAASDDLDLEARVQVLETKEELRGLVLGFAQVVDNSDLAGLEALEPRIHRNFSLTAVDPAGGAHVFEGYDGLIAGYGPIMVAAQANLSTSAIAVELDGDNATATFKFANSTKPPPELGLDVDEKLLLFAANTATFVREDGVWQIESVELVHSLAYPGSVGG
ncbi:hypothetical protein DB30_02044 [Enhygromyxa salina]|uniref:Uncharacterized protein n=1 Tax=Enhygromyxa salina TaxID=215803 RepID=A0A0C1Z3B8_9BACT|nr:nuclear transport factor 2 family protein [Enhygromyxa salina]KIG12099.1 hypothetical protein DB30_02044 [Enhygromyxa salina]